MTALNAAVPSPPSPSPLIWHDNGIEFEPEITFAEWRQACERVKSESQGRQWRAGDLFNAGDDRWSEAHQYLDELGYPFETLANYGNVARAYPIEDRRPLPFTFHQTVYKLPDRLQWLDKALENGWDRAELRAQALGPQAPKAKRWTLAELQESAAGFQCRPFRNNGRKYLAAWLESLAEREGVLLKEEAQS